MSEYKTIKKYYLLTVHNTQLHITVSSFIYKEELLHHNIWIQSCNQDFLTSMNYVPTTRTVSIHTIQYAPKCTIRDFFFEHKSVTLSSLLLGSIQFLKTLWSEMETIDIRDTLTLQTGSSRNGAQHNYLSLFTQAFFQKTWLERYLYAKIKPTSIETRDAEEEAAAVFSSKPRFIDIVKECACYSDNFNYIEFLETYEHEYAACASFGEFVLRFSKKSRFAKVLPWLPTYLFMKCHLPTQFIVSAADIEKRGCLYSSDIKESDVPLIESPLDDHAYYGNDNMHGSDAKIVIKNEIIYTMSFSIEDVE